MAAEVRKTESGTQGWTSTQAYVMAIICLLVGVAGGYLLRGSGNGSAPAPETATAAPANTPGGMPGGMGQQVTPEQLKQMADKQAEPMLAQLKNEPNNAVLLANIGNVYYDAQLYRDATNYYEQALKVDPKNAGVRTDMGTAYFYLGDIDRALTEYDSALKSDPKHGQTLYNIGMVKWQGKGDVKGAVEAWEKLIKDIPDYPDRAKIEQLISRAKEHSNMAPGTKTDKPATM
jgi:cytochrome c-type biogenesis protein CcmH/NrfG